MFIESFLAYKAGKATNTQIEKYVSRDMNEYNMYSVSTMFIVWLLAFFVLILPKMLLAMNCNPNNKFGYGLLAFFFGDIYLLQWAIRKFLIGEKGYCSL